MGTTNQTIELTGHPQLTNTQARLIGYIVDMATDRFYTCPPDQLRCMNSVMKDFTILTKVKR